jgi:hypothetical protein
MSVAKAVSGQPALARVLEHLPDRLGDQFVLGAEMGVETAVSQPGFGHDRRHTDPVGALGADGPCGGVQHLLAGLLLVVFVVAHGLRVLYMMTIR